MTESRIMTDHELFTDIQARKEEAAKILKEQDEIAKAAEDPGRRKPVPPYVTDEVGLF